MARDPLGFLSQHLLALAFFGVMAILFSGCFNAQINWLSTNANETSGFYIAVPYNTLPISTGTSLSNLPLSASGGVAPYTWSIQSGVGAITQQGVFSAGTTAGSVVVQLTDSTGAIATTTLNVIMSLTAIRASADSACALKQDGTVDCWGNNMDGQVGNGSANSNYLTPQSVNILQNVTALGGTAGTNCAVINSGLFCWGNEEGVGLIGNSITSGNSLSPVAVSGPMYTNVTAIGNSSVSSHMCAIASGQVYCWGQGSSGQLGNNTTTSSSYPTPVSTSSGLTGATQVAMGIDHSCAISSSGHVFCWGANENGQLGNGTTANSPVPVPIPTSSLSNVVSITAGGQFTCALDVQGNAYCWGYNSNGQLTNALLAVGVNSDIPIPINSVLGGQVASIQAGYGFACAQLVKTYQIKCWGLGALGRLGDNSTLDSSAPVSPYSNFVANLLAVGYSFVTTVYNGNAINSWGSNSAGQLDNTTVSVGSTYFANIPIAGVPAN